MWLLSTFLNMRTSYLIEFRLNGHPKKYAKRLIFEISKKFKVKGVTNKRPVPHVSLFGPFQTRDSAKMVSAFVKVCKKYDLVPYSILGFNHFDNHRNKVIFLDIKPSRELENLRWDISKSLSPVTTIRNDWDGKKNFSFHATVAFKDIDQKFKSILNYLKSKEKPQIKQHVIRVSIIKNGLIMHEYDFMQKRLLGRSEAKSKECWARSIDILKNKMELLPEKGLLQKAKERFSELMKWGP